MLIQPVQPVFVVLKIGQPPADYKCQMISLSDKQLELKSKEYFEKEIDVSFVAKHFRGKAVIQEVNFSKLHFIYQLNIEEIQFQPGLLINTQL